ncbi:hypothetical protein ACM46_08470 [Chryseobacterium angstadtii]|uniref:Ketohydroxyglutarate aldolase n=1 Tax=Chryseobacterium angstadtii TaxID=558151 RepID=A0A0J7IEI0_9FLAO|nr:hypothetical protein [Chryseobacterium angstadtii]KMQ64316.1 hypothetical protein ACM46_08470 [Chryseobacterium angstadtii]
MKSNIVLTINEMSIHKLDTIVDKLEELGMSVDNVFEFGVIIGTMESNDVGELKTIKEVDSFTVDAQISLPPSDENVQ